MNKEADHVQAQCETCHMEMDWEESYAMFTKEDWRSPFVEYLVEGFLSQKDAEWYKLRKLVTSYFLHKGVLFKKGYNGDLLQCFGLREANEMMKEVHSCECGEHQGRKKLYRCILQMRYYWPTMRRDAARFVKKCHGCQVQANLIRTHF